MKVGNDVATPAVHVQGTAVARCICEAVFPAVRSLKFPCTRIVLAALSMVTVVKPVAGDAFGGLSAGPERKATNTSGSADARCVAPAMTTASAIRMNRVFTE